MTWWVYMLECSGGCIYVGHTEDLKARFAAHLAGTGAGFTRSHPPIRIAYSEEHSNELSAITRERQLKRWSRAKKQAMIAGRLDRIHELARRRRR